jgi:hypothetical protein
MITLGEMHLEPGDAQTLVNLPRQSGVAYAAQESWVQNATIRVRDPIYAFDHFPEAFIQDNIIFGAPYNEERYQKGEWYLIISNYKGADFGLVIVQCGLSRDLELFEAGDATEVGEKGLTLRFVRP